MATDRSSANPGGSPPDAPGQDTLYRTRLQRTRDVLLNVIPALDHEDVEFWGERFTSLHVRFWTRVSFEDYLNRPDYWERIAMAMRWKQTRSGLPVLMSLALDLGTIHITINLN